MTYIPTTLPDNISAQIDIPDDFVTDMLELIKDTVIIETGDHFSLSPLLSGGMCDDSKTKDKDTIIISHEFLANLLIKKYPIELMIYYQQNKDNSLNVDLIYVLVKLLHDDPAFLAARNKELLPTSDLLEDMITFDEQILKIPPNMYNDIASYKTTMDIIASLSQNDR